jgi:predicted ATPase
MSDELNPINFTEYFANLKKNHVTNNREQEIRSRQHDLFEDSLQKVALNEFGQRYVKDHDSQSVTAKKNIDSMIEKTIMKNTGFYISGVPGSGKTHILLEYFYAIVRKHFSALETLEDYPANYQSWMKGICKYYYASWISDLIRNKQKPVIAKFNLLDDFMVEELDGWMLAGWDTYIEEINRRDCVLIVTSNVSPKDILDKPQYSRILSRMAGNCVQVAVPTKDRRQS